ncbi:sulfatase [Coraliomargarita sp. W4R72]
MNPMKGPLLLFLAIFSGANHLLADYAATQPNVLFVICDDLNDSVSGMGGHPQAHTPNLDRFAQTAVRFDNAHANVSICGPSRASFLSGLSPIHTGYYGWAQNPRGGGDLKNPQMTFDRPVLRDVTTFVQNFAQNGYTVYGTGKITHEYHRSAFLFDNVSGIRHWGFSPVTQGPGASDGRRLKNGLLRGAPTTNFMPKRLTDQMYFGPLSDVPDIAANTRTGAPGYQGWIEWGEPFHYINEEDRDLMSDEKSANYAIEVLKEKHTQPFFLAVGFCKPHTPLIAPKKYFDIFKDVEIELPPYKEDDLNDTVELLWKNTTSARSFNLVRAEGLDFWKEWIRAYLACVAFVDHEFGRVIQALDDSPYADNTIVIFTSDHGVHLGEKNMLAKMTLWSESTRIPFLVRTPDMKTVGQQCSRPISLIDIYPTLNDYCNLPMPSQGLDGHSLRPFLEMPEMGQWEGPDFAFCSWMGPPTAQQRSTPYIKAEAANQHLAVVSDRYRYIRASNGKEELYDHRSDPNEWTNQATNPEYSDILKQMQGRLNQQLLSSPKKSF